MVSPARIRGDDQGHGENATISLGGNGSGNVNMERICKNIAKPTVPEFRKAPDFYRLRHSHRHRSATRIRCTVAAARTAGWPGDVRCILLRWGQRQVPPPAAAIAKEFRAQARPQPSQDTPACPTSPWPRDKCQIFRKIRRGRTRRAVRTVAVEPELETPQHPPRHAATLFFPRLRRVWRTSSG